MMLLTVMAALLVTGGVALNVSLAPMSMASGTTAHIKNVGQNEYLFAGAYKHDSSRRYALTYVPRNGWVNTEDTYKWHFEPVAGKIDTYHIKNVGQNEYLYAGADKHDSARRYVLTFVPRKGYVNTETTYQWLIEPVDGKLNTYHIKNVAHNEYLYAGAFKHDSDRRYALTYIPRKGFVNTELTYQWNLGLLTSSSLPPSVTCRSERNGVSTDLTTTCTDEFHAKIVQKVTVNGKIMDEKHQTIEMPGGKKCDQNLLDDVKARCDQFMGPPGAQALVVLTKRVNALMSSIPAKNEGDSQVGKVAVAAGAGAAGGVIAAAVLMVLKRRFTVHEPTLLG